MYINFGSVIVEMLKRKKGSAVVCPLSGWQIASKTGLEIIFLSVLLQFLPMCGAVNNQFKDVLQNKNCFYL